MGRCLAAALVLLASAPMAAACQPHTVALTFAPDVGDRYHYRFEVEATVTRSLQGSEPETTVVHTTLQVDEEVLEVSPGGVRAEVALRRDGGAPRTSEVRLDDAGMVQGIDLIEGQRTGVFGLGALSGVLPTVALPTGPLAPGDRWSIDAGPLTGTGRLARLGVIDGQEVAVLVTHTVEPVDDTVSVGATSAALQGELRARATTAYDLGDGSLLRSTSTARGEVDARIAPPPGVDAGVARGTITYAIAVRVTRIG